MATSYKVEFQLQSIYAPPRVWSALKKIARSKDTKFQEFLRLELNEIIAKHQK